MAAVFFEGSINEAITASVINQKPLVCFITDEEEDSREWEAHYIQDNDVLPLLTNSAVTIRLKLGSVEAGYLSAFCPVNEAPTLLIVNNGVVVENLSKSSTKDEFVSSVTGAIKPKPATDNLPSSDSFNPATAQPATSSTLFSSASTGRTSAAAVAPESMPVESVPGQTQAPPVAVDTTASSTSSEGLNTTPDSDTVPETPNPPQEDAAARNAARLASMAQQTRERIARLREQREKEAKEMEKQREIARREGVKAQQTAVETAKQKGDLTYVEEQRKKREQQQEERKRILAQIEADKLARRDRETRRKELERIVSEKAAEEAESEAAVCRVTRSDECALSFRLLDGSTVRAKFPSSNTVGGEVRKWVDANRTDGDQPYTFTRVRPPQPAKRITSETETLQDLDLTPNASLILVPIGTSKTAVAFAPTGTGWFFSIFIMIWNFIKTILGIGVTVEHKFEQKETRSNAEPEGTTTGKESASSSSSQEKDPKGKRKVFTLHDDDDNRRSAFYNGNQLDFEPRKDEKNDE